MSSGGCVSSFRAREGWVPSDSKGRRWARVEIAGAFRAGTGSYRSSVPQVGSGLRVGL